MGGGSPASLRACVRACCSVMGGTVNTQRQLGISRLHRGKKEGNKKKKREILDQGLKAKYKLDVRFFKGKAFYATNF